MKIENTLIDLDGHELLLRSAQDDDAQILIDYMNQTAKESFFLTYEPEEIKMTLEKELEYIHRMNDSENDCMILAFYDGEHAGNCSFNGNKLARLKHRASVGIALYDRFTEKRIGTAMMKKLIAVAKDAGLEQLELQMVQGNERARNLYQRLGFSIYGVFPNAQKYKDGCYRDLYWMMKSLKEE